MRKCEEIANFGRLVVWSDESHISSAGIFNRTTNRFWSCENNHVTVERQQQGRFGFNVSCFVFGGRLTYHIFDGNLNSPGYVRILDICLPELLDNIPLNRFREVFFQQDGAPCHNAGVVRNYLNERFGQQWIGNNGPIHWPPRSPDLSLLDFFLWGYIKNKIFMRRHESREQLENATRDAFQSLSLKPLFLISSIEAVFKRCGTCLQKNGQQFQQYL